jgi:hypothetical protein
MPAIEGGDAHGMPPISWEDIGLMLQREGTLSSKKYGEREHVMTDFKQPRRLFLEQHNVRRQAGGDRWLNSGGKKGSIVFWVRPGTRIRKRYGKVVAVNRPELRLRYAEFRLVTGPESNPVCNKEGCTVYVLDVIPKEHAHNSRAAARYPARRPPVVFQGGETGAVVFKPRSWVMMVVS